MSPQGSLIFEETWWGGWSWTFESEGSSTRSPSFLPNLKRAVIVGYAAVGTLSKLRAVSTSGTWIVFQKDGTPILCKVRPYEWPSE